MDIETKLRKIREYNELEKLRKRKEERIMEVSIL